MVRPVVVTDGDQRAALAITRSLGRSGYSVIVCASSARSIAGASRFAAASVTVGDPLATPDRFVADVLGAATEYAADFAIPVSEASMRAILPRREDFPCKIPFPDSRRFAEVSDKGLVLAAAERQGIAVPRQLVIQSRDQSYRVDGNLNFPVVAKPARSVAEATEGRVKSGAVHAANQSVLEDEIRRFPDEVFPILVQERILGSGVGVFLLLWDGEVRAAFSHRRIREKPPSGGVSVVSESVALDPNLLEQSVRLLREFGWQGVAMVEYKMDERTGIPYLMEINGRFWGSLQLAIDAGVDFPNLLVAAADGQPATPRGVYKVGARLRWEWGDVDNLLVRLLRSRSRLSLPASVPGRVAGLGDFVRAFGPGTRGEVLRSDDPMPFARETLNWLQRR